MSKFHNDWIQIQGEMASYKNVPRIISLKFRCKNNITREDDGYETSEPAAETADDGECEVHHGMNLRRGCILTGNNS